MEKGKFIVKGGKKMSIVIDLILVAIVALCIFLGKRKGLTGYIIGILAFIISILLAFIVYKPVANFIIQHTQLDETIAEKVATMLEGTNVEKGEEIQKTENNVYPNAFVEQVNQYVKEATEVQAENITDYVAENIATTIVYMITIIVVLIIANIALRIFGFLLNTIAELPILKQFNDVGGIIIGGVEGIVIVYIIITVLTLLLPILKAENFMRAIDNSYIANYIYNHNLIMNLFTK